MSANEACGLRIDVSALPDISQSEMDLLDSSFFQSGDSPRPQLPTPASILEEYGDHGADVVKIKELNLAVKINAQSYLKLEEVQTMWALRKIFPNGEVPVPEVFGWRIYDGRVFLYMSLVSGQTLREAWPSLTADDKSSLQIRLKEIVASLRRLTQSPEIIGKPHRALEGPLSTIKEFNDWLFGIATRQNPEPGKEIQGLDHPDMYRDLLPDTGNIYFTHGDITLGNVIVSGAPGSYTITGIIDWEQAGWYPEYWEYCKLLLGVELDHEWRTEEWGDKITRPFEDTFFAVAEYSLWCCP
ncbi:phosphotransferase enzyme family [Fusarium albosuccineum]|uniref:Phosphotransferase enzyme family n=1 Tax=Fusarium albosuccineum TaxID=1237068 RepID=A0A8H4L5U5_9HYPO|nr:phosphotransferase enzyme family [Fusarium albosuccineum]